jgi:hypothetical protein
MLDGLEFGETEFADLVKLFPSSPQYTPSDLIHRVGRAATLVAYRENRRISLGDVRDAIKVVVPTPVFRSDGDTSR